MAATDSSRTARLDAAAIRRAFPILDLQVHGRPIVYLDNASTTQKPLPVIDRMVRFYREENANVHRGLHHLSERATEAFEEARDAVRRFINAADRREIVFTRGTTESINLVAHSHGGSQVGPGDEIVVSVMEHHSNIVPWQLLCARRGSTLRIVAVDAAGDLDMDAFDAALNERTRLVALAHVSNVLGTVNPVRRVIDMAHARGIVVLVDGAQAVGHIPVDVRALDADFYAFSGHKMLGPTGIGVLYGRLPLLDAMPPFQGGGDMISSVSFDGTTYQAPPYRFEAGTPAIAEAVGLSAAVRYIEDVGVDRIARHEDDLLTYATVALSAVPGVRIIGRAARRTGILSFVLDDVHPHDVATILDRDGVAIRAGHHCCQPLMEHLALPATARASLALYTTREDIDALVAAIRTVREVFG